MLNRVSRIAFFVLALSAFAPALSAAENTAERYFEFSLQSFCGNDWFLNALSNPAARISRANYVIDSAGDRTVEVDYIGDLRNPYSADNFVSTSPYFRSSSGSTLSALVPSAPNSAAPDLYWRTDGTAGTWTGLNWSNPATATGGTGWTAGDDAFFTANSTVTYVTATSFADITVDPGVTVTVTPAGTVPAGTHVITVGAGGLLSWASQSYNATTTLTKSGDGTWNIGAISNAYTGGFTLNAGTAIVSGNNSLSGATLTINGGTIESSGTRNFAATSIVVGGNFALAGTGNATWGAPVNIGASTRTITNNTTSTATRTFSGIITGGGGLTFDGTGGSGGIVLTGANTYTGATIINGGLVTSGVGSLVSTSSVTVNNGGTLLLSGNGRHIGANTGVTLNGGTFNTGGFSEPTTAHDATPASYIGTLTLDSTSTINLGTGASILAFTNSSGQTWTGTLNIYNWSGSPITGNGTDQVYFGTDATGLTLAQLGQINFYSDAGTTFLGIGSWGADLDGEIVPVAIPEPGTWIGAGLALLVIGYMQLRKRSRAGSSVS